jgi:hypothetical protein
MYVYIYNLREQKIEMYYISYIVIGTPKTHDMQAQCRTCCSDATGREFSCLPFSDSKTLLGDIWGYTDMFFLVENGGIPLPWPRHRSCELGGQLVHHNAT